MESKETRRPSGKMKRPKEFKNPDAEKEFAKASTMRFGPTSESKGIMEEVWKNKMKIEISKDKKKGGANSLCGRLCNDIHADAKILAEALFKSKPDERFELKSRLRRMESAIFAASSEDEVEVVLAKAYSRLGKGGRQVVDCLVQSVGADGLGLNEFKKMFQLVRVFFEARSLGFQWSKGGDNDGARSDD